MIYSFIGFQIPYSVLVEPCSSPSLFACWREAEETHSTLTLIVEFCEPGKVLPSLHLLAVLLQVRFSALINDKWMSQCSSTSTVDMHIPMGIRHRTTERGNAHQNSCKVMIESLKSYSPVLRRRRCVVLGATYFNWRRIIHNVQRPSQRLNYQLVTWFSNQSWMPESWKRKSGKE